MIWFKTLLVVFICLPGLLGCSKKVLVVDNSGLRFYLKNLAMENGEVLEVLDGNAIRKIPLEKISKIVIDPGRTHFENDKLYYSTYIRLTGGSVIEPRVAGVDTTHAYVHLKGTLIGTEGKTEVKIPLNKLNSMLRKKE